MENKITVETGQLNCSLVCKLCDGYFRNATTITECLHSFCESCIVRFFFQGNHNCPICDKNLGTNPANILLFDRALDDLVNKIFPHLTKDDTEKEAAFYKAHNFAEKKQEEISKKRPSELTSNSLTKKQKLSQESKSMSAIKNKNAAVSNSKNGRQSKSLEKTITNKEDIEISFVLIPEKYNIPKEERLEGLRMPFLHTSGKLRVSHLRKYIGKKLSLENLEDLEICCNGVSLGRELSVQFIKRTRWVDAGNDMILTYQKQCH